MRAFVITSIAALSLLGAGAAFAQSQDSSGSPATPPAPKDRSQEVVCRRQEVPGSRLGGASICHTRAEWAQIDDENRKYSDQALRPSLSGAQPK
jgi:hypothetical protein